MVALNKRWAALPRVIPEFDFTCISRLRATRRPSNTLWRPCWVPDLLTRGYTLPQVFTKLDRTLSIQYGDT